jgi:ribonuclease HI
VVWSDDHGTVLAEDKQSIGRATNNVAEYRGLIAGLEEAVKLGATDVDVFMDSKLVVEQMSGRWKVKHPDMAPLHQQATAPYPAGPGLPRDPPSASTITFTSRFP